MTTDLTTATTAELIERESVLVYRLEMASRVDPDLDRKPIACAASREVDEIRDELVRRRAHYESQRTEAQLQQEAQRAFDTHHFRRY